MELHIQNFGPVKEAKIDLSKDFIILTGENNTGKTYVANAVAAIESKHGFDVEVATWEGLFDFSMAATLSIDLEDKFLNLIAASNAVNEPNEIIGEFVNTELDQKTNFTYYSLKNNLQIIKENYLDYSFNQPIKAPQISLDNSKKAAISISKQKGSYALNIQLTNVDSAKYEEAKSIITNMLVYVLAPITGKNIFFIPAERQGINLFSKELSLLKNRTFDKLLSNGKREEMLSFLSSRFNRYPKSIQDGLAFIQNLDFIRTQKSDFAYLADELDQMMNGQILINDQGDISFQPENATETVEISMTSSTVKSLSWLSIYLRHTAKKGDFIIIDEPELNLHPDNQIKIARFLVRLRNAGFKLMISTHSDFIIRELNTLLVLHKAKKEGESASQELMRKYNYEEEELLDGEQLGVYLFRQGKAVEQVLIDDEGFYVQTIDEAVSELNQAAENVYFELS